jgi:putative hemolysin
MTTDLLLLLTLILLSGVFAMSEIAVVRSPARSLVQMAETSGGARDAMDVNREKLRKDVHSVLPLCDGGLEHVVSFIRSTTLLDRMLGGHAFEMRALVEPPLFVPETMTLMRLLEQFKRTRLPVALVVDEFGGVEGLVSLTDVIGSIVGDLSSEPGEEPTIVRREDGSWLFDGALDLDTVLQTLALSRCSATQIGSTITHSVDWRCSPWAECRAPATCSFGVTIGSRSWT